MQTILGAGGVIGTELAKELKKYTSEIRLVSRQPKAVNPTDELFSADLLQSQEVMEAVRGSDIVYLTVGFDYKARVWKKAWPKVISHVIQACTHHGCKLVFFDNMYLYDPNRLNPMNEDTPINPSSKKGKVRAKVAKMIMDEVNHGNLTALIARSADFYGPGIKDKGLLNETVFAPLSKGKFAKWFASADCPHSFTFTPDAGKATALLGNTVDAYNQVWHLPTAGSPPTGKEWIHMIAEEMGTSANYQVVYKWMIQLIGTFVPIMKELNEMVYQYDRPYVFDSSKFEKQFFFKPTAYVEGIRRTLRKDYPHLFEKHNKMLG